MLLLKESRISQFWLNWKSLGPISFDELHHSAVWHSFCTDRAVLHQVSTKRYVFLTFLSLKYDQYFRVFLLLEPLELFFFTFVALDYHAFRTSKLRKLWKWQKTCMLKKIDIHFQIFQMMLFFTRADSLKFLKGVDLILARVALPVLPHCYF